METKMQFIFTKEEIERIKEKIKENGHRTVVVDLHGLSVKKAHRMLLNLIALDRNGYDILAIHGYNHGTAIKNMITADLSSPRIQKKKTPAYNPGQTIISVNAA